MFVVDSFVVCRWQRASIWCLYDEDEKELIQGNETYDLANYLLSPVCIIHHLSVMCIYISSPQCHSQSLLLYRAMHYTIICCARCPTLPLITDCSYYWILMIRSDIIFDSFVDWDVSMHLIIHLSILHRMQRRWETQRCQVEDRFDWVRSTKRPVHNMLCTAI